MSLIREDQFTIHHPLFQRVTAPGRNYIYCFGCGGSGLDKAAEEFIEKFFSWDYMGAAEFEFGKAAECLAFMFDNKPDLVTHDEDGYYYLVRKDVRYEAVDLFTRLVKNLVKSEHSLGLKNPEVLGWFDFKNGFFVSRDLELRDSIKRMLEEVVNDPVQT